MPGYAQELIPQAGLFRGEERGRASMIWPIRQSGRPRHSVGNTVTSFGSPS
jgi:hypothetical protein